MSRETETACWGAQTCKLDPACADYAYQCKAQAERDTQIRADERRKVAEESICYWGEAAARLADDAAIARQVGDGQ